jgi:SulP family sulfate permease
VSQQRPSQGLPASIVAGVAIGMVETVFAISFAALVFGGLLVGHVADGIGLYLAAAAVTLGLFAWRAGARGVVGSLQGAAAAVLAVVATSTAIGAFGGLDRTFLTVIAATLVVTVLTGVTFLVLSRFELGDLVRYVPVPVVGGFLAGTGWLLVKGGIGVSAGTLVSFEAIGDLIAADALKRWLPALAFGVLLLVLTRLIRRPLVLPIAIGAGFVAFAVGMLVTGSSIDAARDGRWLLGPFPPGPFWQPWTLRAVSGADWLGVLKQAPLVLAGVFVIVLAMLMNVGGTESILRRDLDASRELRDAGLANVVTGAVGGITGYHALSLTALTHRSRADARMAGAVGALMPLAAVAVGVDAVELVPRMLVGGALVFLGLAFIVEWVWDRRRSLPRSEYIIMLLVLAVIVGRGFLPGVVVGLVLAVVLLAVDYGQIELVREVAFGDTFRSNVDRAPGERAALHAAAERVQILRVQGFVFFGTASGLLERIRGRADAGGLRYLVLDLRRVTGIDASAVVALHKAAGIARAGGFELVLTGLREGLRDRLARGGVVEEAGVVRFEPDLDHGLEHCEDGLLAEGVTNGAMATSGAGDGDAPAGLPAGMPAGLDDYLERMPLAEGTALIHQGDAPDDVFVLASGRLRIEMRTPEGMRMRLRTVLPGAVVGELALYTGTVRTADVVAEAPSVVLRLTRASIERMEADRPELAAAVHRWLATTVSERLTDTQRAVGALMDR